MKRSLVVAFLTPTIDERGTCIALYDYAHYNETILKNQSIILCPKNGINNAASLNREVLSKFDARFPLFYYDETQQIDDICRHCDVLYCIKYGTDDGIFSRRIKTVIHCVFDMSQPHGHIYAGVSEQLARKFNSNVFVPHMVNFEPSADISTTSFRRSLNIPDSATVFGRHGGSDTFDIQWVKSVIEKSVRLNPDIYFIFVNTPRFCAHHPNIFFLDKIINLNKKKEFISSCDAMIHAQSLGESFGLAIAEFSVHQKPIICFGNWVLNDNYRKILGDKAIYYHSDNELLEILFRFDKSKYKDRTDLNCYEAYSPANVMTKFEKVFLL
jgi:hypothetical protein